MYKEAEINTHDPTGMFPSRLSLGFLAFVFVLIYTYIKYQKVPHGLFQKQIYSFPFSSFLLPPSLWTNTFDNFLHVSNLQTSIIIS